VLTFFNRYHLFISIFNKFTKRNLSQVSTARKPFSLTVKLKFILLWQTLKNEILRSNLRSLKSFRQQFMILCYTRKIGQTIIKYSTTKYDLQTVENSCKLCGPWKFPETILTLCYTREIGQTIIKIFNNKICFVDWMKTPENSYQLVLPVSAINLVRTIW
jgi:hypothetical protein